MSRNELQSVRARHHLSSVWWAVLALIPFLASCGGGGGGGGGAAGSVSPGSLDTTITQAPAERTTASVAMVTFQTSGPAAHVEGRLNGVSWETIQSPWTSPSLDDGEHVLEVRAVSGSGEADETPALARWTVDTKGPRILMSYPGSKAFTTADSTALFGKTEDSGSIESLLIDGVDASSSDGLANWNFRSSLISGDNSIQIEAIDDLGNRSSRTVKIRNDELMYFPSAVSIDKRRSQAIVAAQGPDSFLGILFGVDLATGETKEISGPTRGAGPSFGSIHDVFVSDNSDRVFVSDQSMPAIFEVNLITGDRKELSGPNRGSGETLIQPAEIVHDPFGGVIYAVEPNWGRVLRIDAASGDRSVFFTTDAPTAVAFEWDNRHLFVYDQFKNDIFWVDSSSGQSGVQVDGDDASGPKIGNLDSMTWASLRRRFLYVTDRDTGRILGIDLDGGRFTIAEVGDEKGPLSFPRGLTYSQDYILVCDQHLQELVKILPGGVERTTLTSTSVGDGEPLGDAWKLARKKGGTLLSLGRGTSPLHTVSTATAQRASAPDWKGVQPSSLQDIATSASGRTFVLDGFGGTQLLEVDLGTGEATLVSGSGRGQGGALITPTYFEVSSNGETAWVWDAGYGNILEVDLATGNRQLFTGSGPIIGVAGATALDEAGGRLFVSDDKAKPQVYAIDLSTGDRTLVPGGPGSRRIAGMAWDAVAGRLLAVSSAMTAIDVSTGSRTEISGPNRGQGLAITTATDVIYEADRQRCYVSSLYASAILIIDLQSGDRAIFSK